MISLIEKIKKITGNKILEINGSKEEIKDIVCKKEKVVAIIKDHLDFENFIHCFRNQALKLKEDNPGKFIPGIIVFNIKGKNSLREIKKDLVLLDAAANMMFYFGNKNELDFESRNLFYRNSTKLLKEEHQKFFIFDSPTISSALISRKMKDGSFEGIITNDRDIIKKIIDKIIYKK